MTLLPKSVNKILSKLQSPTPPNTIPVYQKNNSNITLFDELPEVEKQAAIIKLQQLAAEQPGSTTPSPKKTRSCFNWKTFAMVFLGLGFVTFAVVASVALAIDVDKDPDLVAKLRMANTNLDRMNLLPDDSDWTFDFTKQDKYTFSPGGVVNANAATFPATVGQGMTMAMLNLGPCSMLPPHLHPRATNYVVAISGTTMTYMIAENGARTVTETLTAGQMTIFPQASIHTMMNIGCENAQLISALNSDDTGTTNLANAFFSLPQNITGTVIGGGINVATVDGQLPAIGTGSNAGPEACIAACAAKGKMIKRTF
ncbi:hypothetical protein LTR10_017772 [Elasticomyces elasticus]|uniref:Cupin type-1 domain-containing protein n=1 Tax=Exophiala sideris TaxID=1016849 RepID=A0ABR0JC88_9EURO|nr:hypothetical protein LTR10_017772 [Elasticomyces elasticus]KAK5031281.1 hypothetical protein LTS07_005016 [Exophiala sideris]KAK5039001.1 hypothetical protein LTR13_004032 [Exophiala sideris]KAK5060886.1 hypothetical protein LTR69_005485 [Exophiala sideris]KAK5183797.1 hypothetical protein LTR44_004079 [Eurotiomycetes sp. CCFEE 6388]